MDSNYHSLQDQLDGHDTDEESRSLKFMSINLSEKGLRKNFTPSHERKSPDTDHDLDRCLQQLERLKTLHEQGLLNEKEFNNRRLQLIDAITNTKNDTQQSRKARGYSTVSTVESWIGPIDTTGTKKSQSRGSRKRSELPTEEPTIIPHPPPVSWAHIPYETALKHEYHYKKRKWIKSKIKVQLDNVPFAKGNLRFCCHLNVKGEEGTFVAKMSSDPRDTIERSIYFRDCEMQEIARFYAREYNSYDPPKKVQFLPPWVLQLKDRQFEPLVAMEPYLTGHYQKWLSNYHFADVERNTPHAFAHFTFESSNRNLIVCDIQGVQDIYTDPQVHNKNGKGFGRGNLGQKGFEGFLMQHRCNLVCNFLRLPNISQLPIEQIGTMPARTHMQGKMQIVNVGVGNHDTPLPTGFNNDYHSGGYSASEDSQSTRCPCCIL